MDMSLIGSWEKRKFRKKIKIKCNDYLDGCRVPREHIQLDPSLLEGQENPAKGKYALKYNSEGDESWQHE